MANDILNATIPVRPAGAAAVTANANEADQKNREHRGLVLTVDITAVAGTTPTLVVTIEGKDAISGKYYTILASATLSATGTTVLRVHPDLPDTANSKAADILPDTWRVRYTVGGTTPSFTFTVGAVLVK